MDADKKYLARKMFQTEIYKRNGQAFEDFFVSIMSYRYPGFQAVKPFGSIGDRKNDGFDSEHGIYYQVYGPENLEKSLTKAIKKINTDFIGLHNQWNSTTPIQEFYFVVNDKYSGIHPDLSKELKKIEENYPDIKCLPMSAKDLERICFELEDDQLTMVLGQIPTPDIDLFDDMIMKDAVAHLLSIDSSLEGNGFPANPDFNDKIIFNKLSSQVGELLKYASFKEADLKDFFKWQEPYVKEKLQSKFASIYRRALGKFRLDDQSDNIFFFILNESCSDRKRSVQEAVLVLMAYYFSYCDIFEEPPIPGQSKLF